MRERWLALLETLLPVDRPRRRIPLNIPDERLLGGLDLAATLQAGRPVAQRGVLAETDGGVVTLAMAERVPAATATRLAQVLDRGEVQVARDGIEAHLSARFGVIALDESGNDDEPPASVLTERLGVVLSLEGLLPSTCTLPPLEELRGWQRDIVSARTRWRHTHADDEALQALVATAAALGVDSPRASLAALNLARMAAALDGRDAVDGEDCTLAARLVIAPRATRLPPQHTDESPPEPPPEPPQDQDPPSEPDPPTTTPSNSPTSRSKIRCSRLPRPLFRRACWRCCRRRWRWDAPVAGASPAPHRPITGADDRQARAAAACDRVFASTSSIRCATLPRGSPCADARRWHPVDRRRVC